MRWQAARPPSRLKHYALVREAFYIRLVGEAYYNWIVGEAPKKEEKNTDPAPAGGDTSFSSCLNLAKGESGLLDLTIK